jgi:AraC-like DNA-binding protein
VGTSIYRYVIFRRLLQARELMSAGEPPGEVYQLCGFGDYANFYRAFKGEYGISPREFVAAMK